jgi:predicted transcriptional regulator
VELTPQAETLLRHMADEVPTTSLDEAATETGLTPRAIEVAMRELCDGGYANERPPRVGAGTTVPDRFEITRSGRRFASRLD